MITPLGRPWTRRLLAVVVAAAAFAAATAVASAAPATQTLIGAADGPTPDIRRGGLTIFDAAGQQYATGSAGTINFALDGAPYVGFCVDTSRNLSEDPEPVEVVVEDPPTTPARRAATWLLVNRTPTGPPTEAKRDLAAATQIALWLLLDPRVSQTAPTSNAALNAAGIAAAQEALAATAVPASLALSAPAPAAGATSAVLTVTGKPGAVVSLAVTSGAGTLSSGQVTIGAGGTATVTLTTTGPGVVGVGATTAGDGRLLLVDPTAPDRPQPTTAAQPSQLSANAAVAFSPAQVTPPPTVRPTAPQGPIVGRPTPALRIAKSAPARSRVLAPVRYRITVSNPSRVTARRVTLRDRIPAGLSFVRASRRHTTRNGTLVFALGDIRPGGSRSVSVWLRADASVRGARVNVATAGAVQVSAVSTSVRTLFLAPLRRIQPAVTG